MNKQARGGGKSNCRWAGNLIVADQVFSRFVGWDELVLLKPRASPGTMSSSSQTTTTHALLAQLAEQLTLNQRVVGSSPTGGISASNRQDTSKRVNPKGLRQAESPQRSSQGATESDTTRPSRATRGPTRPCQMTPTWPPLWPLGPSCPRRSAPASWQWSGPPRGGTDGGL